MSDEEQDQKRHDKKRGNNKQQRSRGGGGGGGGKLRGLPSDSPQVRLSKTLSWILRHGATSQGLHIRSDGYVPVDELLANPKLRAQSLTLTALMEIVEADEKKRYDLKCEETLPETTEGGAAGIANVWLIRANQGHSMKDVAELELVPIQSVDDIPSKIAVHGTSLKAWASIQKEGLSKMTRNHIHLAQGIIGSDHNVISGMRKSSQILIYINVPKAIAEGNLKFHLSSNGVVLSEGDEEGYIRPTYFDRVVDVRKGKEIELVPNANGEWTPQAQA